MAADAVLISGSHHRSTVLADVLQDVGWLLRVHLDPSAALRDIRANPYDALFCDERLRGATASGFLSWHTRLAPQVPFYLIAEAGDELSSPVRGAVTQVLPYPLPRKVVPPPPDTTQWERLANPIVPLEGDTETVALTHLIETLGANDGSAVIETAAGSVHLARGRIEHATYVTRPDAPPLLGLRALAELIGARSLRFRVLPHTLPPQRSLNQPIMTALAEASRRRDESLRNGRILAAVHDAHPHARGLAIGYPLNATPDDTWGEGDAAHGLLHDYARATTALPSLAKPSHLALESAGLGWALLALRNDAVLSGVTAPGKSMSLLTAMIRSVRDATTNRA